MTLQEIKDAINAGKKVCLSNHGYEVLKPKNGTDKDLQISYKYGGQNTIGLTWLYGKTMNGKEDDFFLKWTRSRHGLPLTPKEAAAIKQIDEAIALSMRDPQIVHIPYTEIGREYLMDIAEHMDDDLTDAGDNIVYDFFGDCEGNNWRINLHSTMSQRAAE